AGVRDLAIAAGAAELLDGLDHALAELGGAGVAEGHQAAIGGDRTVAAEGDAAVHDEVAAFALAAEAEGLELADHLEGERIVELADIDVLGREAGHAEAALRGCAADPADLLPERRQDVAGAAPVFAAAQDVHRLLAQVAGALGGREDHAAAAFRSRGAFE